ncbi:MAG TPA: hypothetical protein VMU99_07320 [Acidimicrobiales bacterium]|nr:hypothetical protein [Acidimicrobiales bacterium]
MSGSTRPHRKLTPLQKGLAFYKGQTITVIDSGTVGGPYDLYARVIMPYIAEYLHASFKVEDISIANGVPGMNQAAAASPTGLTAGVFQQFTSISHLVAGVQGLNFNVERLAWIAGDGLSTQVLVASASSGITSVAELMSASKTAANSGTPISMILGANGSLVSAVPQAVLGVLGIHLHFIPGYPSVSVEATGLERGDAPLTFLPSSIIGPLITGGKAKALAITGKIPLGTLYRGVESSAPTFAQLFRKYPPKTKAQKAQASSVEDITSLPSGLLALQTGVAGYKVDAMRAAAIWAEKRPGFRSQMLSYSLNPKVYNPVTAKSAFIKSIKEETSLGCFLAGTC